MIVINTTTEIAKFSRNEHALYNNFSQMQYFINDVKKRKVAVSVVVRLWRGETNLTTELVDNTFYPM